MNNRIIQLIAFTFFLLLSEILCSQELGCLNYTPTEGLVQSQVQDMFQDSKGFIWLGTKGGVSRFDGTNFKNYTTNEGLIDNSILKIFEVNNNCLFILTRIGFSLLSNNKFINYYLPNNINLLVSANSYGFDDDNNIIFPYFESESLKFAKYVNGKTFPCSKINKLISENKSFQKQNYIGLEIIYSRNYKCFYILLNNEIGKVEEEANRLQSKYLNFEHEYAYSNETTRILYMEIKQLEKQLNEKRKILLDELQKFPLFRDVGKKRTEIFSRLSKLREEAAITQSEINKLEHQSVDEKNEK